MGLALSVLVFSVGVLEALSCLEHARQSYLPLDLGRKRRRLVLDLGSGSVRHRETRRSSEFQRDPSSFLRRLSRQATAAEDEVCEELAAIWDRVERGRVHSSEARPGGEAPASEAANEEANEAANEEPSEPASTSSTPDTVIHLPEDDHTTDQTDIPLEEGFCPKCVDESFDLLASAAFNNRDVILGAEGACCIHDQQIIEILHLERETSPSISGAVSASGVAEELVPSPSSEGTQDLAPHQDPRPIIDQSVGKIRKEAIGSEALITSELEDRTLIETQTSSSEPTPVIQLSDVQSLLESNIIEGVDNYGNKLFQIESGDAGTSPASQSRTLLQEVTEIVSEWLGLSNEKLKQQNIPQEEANYPTLHEHVSENEIDGHVNPLFVCFQEKTIFEGSQTSLLKDKDESELPLENLAHGEVELPKADKYPEDESTNISRLNNEQSLTKQETAKGKLQKQNNIDIGRTNKHKEMLRTGTYIETDISELDFLDDKSSLGRKTNGGDNTDIINTEDILQVEEIPKFKEEEEGTLFQSLVEKTKTHFPNAIGEGRESIDDMQSKKEQDQSTTIEYEIKTTQTTQLFDPRETKQDKSIDVRESHDSENAGVLSMEKHHEHDRNQIMSNNDSKELTVSEHVAEKVALSMEIKKQAPEALDENQDIVVQKPTAINEHGSEDILRSLEVEVQVQNISVQNQIIGEKVPIDNNLTEHATKNIVLLQDDIKQVEDILAKNQDNEVTQHVADEMLSPKVVVQQLQNNIDQKNVILGKETIENKVSEHTFIEMGQSQEVKEQDKKDPKQSEVISKQVTIHNTVTKLDADEIRLASEVEKQVQDTLVRNKLISEEQTNANEVTNVTGEMSPSQEVLKGVQEVKEQVKNDTYQSEVIPKQVTIDNKVTKHAADEIELASEIEEQVQNILIHNKLISEDQANVNEVTNVSVEMRPSQEIKEQDKNIPYQSEIISEQVKIENEVTEIMEGAIATKDTQRLAEEMRLAEDVKDKFSEDKIIIGQETIGKKVTIQTSIIPDQEKSTIVQEKSTIVQLESKEIKSERESQLKEIEDSKALEDDDESQAANRVEASEINENSTKSSEKQIEVSSKSQKEIMLIEETSGTEKGSALIKDVLVEDKLNKDSQLTTSADASQRIATQPPLEVRPAGEHQERKPSSAGEEVAGEDPDRRALQDILITKERLKGLVRQETEEVRPMEEVTRVEGTKPRQPPGLTPVEDITSPDKAFWLIFSGEYTKAMSKDWHSGHFCCWQCDESLTGQRYVLRDDHPYCIKCYEQVFANTCDECSKVIGIDSKDLSYKDKHWHEACFLCSKCRVSLVDKQFGSKADKIYCGNCYDAQFASRCDGCGQIFRAGTKKMEYKTRQWHEQCFCCCVCKTAIGTKSFIPREQEIYCAGCYEEKFATRCVKCNKIITSGGVTYKNEPWHRECFTCTNCSTSLAGQRFTSRDEKPYCADCFGELFAKRCTSCCKPITGIGGTRFISFEDRHWHNDCFICASCKSSLVGRGFITDAEDILCTECAKQKLM